MAQRMLLREPSPSGAVGLTPSSFGDTSLEDKLMLYNLFDRHENANAASNNDSELLWVLPSQNHLSSRF